MRDMREAQFEGRLTVNRVQVLAFSTGILMRRHHSLHFAL